MHYVVLVAEKVLSGITPLLSGLSVNKDSGYLTIRDRINGSVLITVQIGKCKPEKAKKYFDFSLEKGARLFQHKKHFSSWQSKDEGEDFYAGAIISEDLILSFSGLSELADEALVLMVANLCRWIHDGDAYSIAAISDNKYFTDLRSGGKLQDYKQIM
ncbi:hypothetical protein KJ786_01255 [Patescibacteria group bacterium]|nr:hypothetical protein [Patescibacteria group bacterium]